MPFVTKSHMQDVCFFSPKNVTYKPAENGVFIRSVSFAVDKLPPLENFSLDKIIEAGLPLEKVKTIIKEPSISADLLLSKMEAVDENNPQNKE